MGDVMKTGLPGLNLWRVDERWTDDLGQWIDIHLRRDYYMPRRQLRELIARPQSDVWAMVLNEELIGIAIVWGDVRLHNLLLTSEYRGKGYGRVVVQALGIEEVRAKSDMSTGDPTRFYEKIGFQTTAVEGKRNQIKVMTRTATKLEEVPITITTSRMNELLEVEKRWKLHREASSARALAAARTRAKMRSEKETKLNEFRESTEPRITKKNKRNVVKELTSSTLNFTAAENEVKPLPIVLDVENSADQNRGA